MSQVQDQLKDTQFAWADRGEYVEVTSPWGNQYHCFGPGRYGKMKLGIPYVEFTVPHGTAGSIQRFYEQVFGSPGEVKTDSQGVAAYVEVGPNQQLIFRESDSVADYDGHHIAIYVSNFSGPFQYLEQRGLLTEGLQNHQFRFQDIVDPDSGKPVFTVEHEVRSTRHPLYRRQLVNREPENPPM